MTQPVSKIKFITSALLDTYMSTRELMTPSPVPTLFRQPEPTQRSCALLYKSDLNTLHLLFDSASPSLRQEITESQLATQRFNLTAALTALSSPYNQGVAILRALTHLAWLNDSLRKQARNRFRHGKSKIGPRYPGQSRKQAAQELRDSHLYIITQDALSPSITHYLERPNFCRALYISAAPFTIEYTSTHTHTHLYKVQRSTCAIPGCNLPISKHTTHHTTYYSPFCKQHTKQLSQTTAGRERIFSTCYFCGWTGITILTEFPNQPNLINVCPNCHSAMSGLGDWNKAQHINKKQIRNRKK